MIAALCILSVLVGKGLFGYLHKKYERYVKRAD